MTSIETAFENEYSFLKYLDASETRYHEDIAVKRTAYWCHCGPLLDPSQGLPAKFDQFEKQVFTGSVRHQLTAFLSYVNKILLTNGLRHYFLTIRASTPTHDFDRPRWHTDDLFFASTQECALPGTRLHLKSPSPRSQQENGTSWKICTTILGPSTLFIPQDQQSSARKRQESARKNASTDHECLSIRCVGCATAADAVREELAATLGDLGTEAASEGECTVFKVGRNFGAVHSEPCMSEYSSGRVFVNVVPGTEEELGELMGKWGMEFPRQWWVGVLMQVDGGDVWTDGGSDLW
ncbi:hypothetical protein ACLX1H_001176 [Fusarium chlamydosporum]